MPKRFHLGLLPRIIIAILLGILFGQFMPEWGVRLFATFNEVFGQFLGFLIPLIIVGFVAPAIGDIGTKAGKLLVFTVLLAYLFTLMSGFISYFTSASLFPDMVQGTEGLAATEDVSIGVEPYISLPIPPLMPVMTALVLAFMLGIGIAYSSGTSLRNGMNEFRDIVSATIRRVIIPLLPFYILGIFLNMTYVGQVSVILSTFSKIILVIFGIHIFVLLLEYCIAALFARRNPFKMLWTMMPAYFTALGTQSSAATIPVTLRQTIKMSISEDVAGFVVPLCATIHMSGSILKLVACSMAILLMSGQPIEFSSYAYFIAMLGVTIIAAPGIPGGAVMASLGLLSSILGFTDAQNALMIALYIAMDNFGTACNVTGDGAVATIVNRFFGKAKAN